MFKLHTKAPTRIDFCGGTLDLWPLHQIIDHSCTINVGISLFAEVKISVRNDKNFELLSKDYNKKISGNYEAVTKLDNELPLIGAMLRNFWDATKPGLNIETMSGSPPGAGLGGSSALAIAIANSLSSLNHKMFQTKFLDEISLVETCRDIEAKLIHTPTGVQDYWGAVHGGFNLISFAPGNTRNESFNQLIDQWNLDDELVIFYSGQSRDSAINNWEIFKNAFNREPNTLRFLRAIADSTQEARVAMTTGERQRFIDASKKEWIQRCNLWPGVETERTKKLTKIALDLGADLVRVCGAGGGGVMVGIAPKSRMSEIKQSLAGAGARILDAKIVRAGVQTSFQ